MRLEALTSGFARSGVFTLDVQRAGFEDRDALNGRAGAPAGASNGRALAHRQADALTGGRVLRPAVIVTLW